MPTLLRPSRRDVATRPPAPGNDITRRDLLRGIGALGAGWVLAGCATDTAPTDVGDTATSTRSVDHPLGTAEVPVEPQRVVAVTGTVEVDCLVALGVVPVAAAELEQGVGFSQQVADELDGVTMLGTRREIDLEAVAAQQPDLIIGTVGWLGDIHDQLSEIAPTVAIDDATGWRGVTRQVAEAVGRQDRAEQVIADVDAQLEALVGEVGGALEGLTYTLMVSFAISGEYGLYRLPDDVDEILQRLGMVRPERQLELFGPDEFYAPISTEQVDVIDTDAICLFGYDDPESRTEIEAARGDELFAALSAARDGMVFEVDSDHWYFATPQAVEQVLEDLRRDVVPTLLEA